VRREREAKNKKELGSSPRRLWALAQRNASSLCSAARETVSSLRDASFRRRKAKRSAAPATGSEKKRKEKTHRHSAKSPRRLFCSTRSRRRGTFVETLSSSFFANAIKHDRVHGTTDRKGQRLGASYSFAALAVLVFLRNPQPKHPLYVSSLITLLSLPLSVPKKTHQQSAKITEKATARRPMARV